MDDQTETDLTPNDIKSDDNQSKTYKPNIIIMDIYGVITSWDFAKELKCYLKNNLSFFLSRNWRDKSVVNIVTKLREQSAIDRCAGIEIPLIAKEEPDKELEVIQASVVANIFWQMDKNHKTSQIQLNSLFNIVWSDAYKTNRLKTHAFIDVKQALNHWRFHLFIKIFAFASGPPEGQKLFLQSSIDGDLTQYFANYINSSIGNKYDSNKYRGVIIALRESDPEMLLYMTDEPKKARAAIESGMKAVVVIRPGNATYSQKQLRGLTKITSFHELQFEQVSKKSAPTS